MTEKSRFCEVCPRGLTSYPTEICERALATIDAVANGKSDSEPGLCPWHCVDYNSNYCFWVLFERDAPIDDERKIAILLGLTPAQVKDAIKTAVGKLKNDKKEDMLNLAEEVAQREFYTMDLSWKLSTADVETVEDMSKAKDVPSSTHLRGFSGAAAVHGVKRRGQIYGLSQNWYENAKKFADAGTPILMAKYELHSIKVVKKDEGQDADNQCSEENEGVSRPAKRGRKPKQRSV